MLALRRRATWLGLLLCACAHKSAVEPPPGPAPTTEAGIASETARQKLAKLSKNRVQLWVVVHVRAHKHVLPDGSIDEKKLLEGALSDADAVVLGGGDAIVLINSRCEMPLYEKIIAAVRERYPDFPLGISALAYGPSNLTEGFRLAKKFNAQIVWTENVPGEHIEYEGDDGKWIEAPMTDRALALETQSKERPEALHVSGVHMKYTRPLDGVPFDAAMRRALGSVDGINITGAETGVLADLERVKLARQIAGPYPLGLASGVSTENIAQVIGYIDYAIVGTSLKMTGNDLRTDEDKVRELRALMTQLGGGPGE